MAFCEIRDLHKSYDMDGKRIEVLRGLDLVIHEGEMLSLTGASGTGKSTFLHVLGTLDNPTAGTIRFHGVEVSSMDEAQLAEFRNRTIGFVFQSHHLLPEFSALENVMMPALIQRLTRGESARRARELLEAVGLGERAEHKPGELSGGEQQRVALARALVLHPKLLLADEPTGNLDPETGEGVHQVLKDLNRRLGIAAVVVTHNDRLAQAMPRKLQIVDGRVVELTGAKSAPTPAS
ncbi:MAG TPA: lipoprotein-releasing system ATP-binding protein LolD [Myxococcales bacterium]|nr:lipoprotein-releasing system ATP-binding protein LolD [Myxococcales bacterium]